MFGFREKRKGSIIRSRKIAFSIEDLFVNEKVIF
jgi:hypothetical protein